MSLKNEFLKNWENFRTELEEFSLQFSLGKAEVKDKLENFKSKFSDDLQSFDARIDDLIKNGRPYLQDLKQEIDTFRLQINLGKAENKEEIDAYLQSLQQSYRNISHKFGDRFEQDAQLKAQWDEAKTALNEQISKMRAAFEGMKVQTSLGEMDAKDEFEKFKKNAAQKMAEFEKMSGVQWEEVDAKAQSFFDEIQTFFVKFKDEMASRFKK